MEKIIDKMTLTVILSDDMTKCAIEKGYKLPCISIKHHYGHIGKFVKLFNIDGSIKSYELEVCDRTTKKWIHLYLIPV